jgi:type IV secretion system protein VirB2
MLNQLKTAYIINAQAKREVSAKTLSLFAMALVILILMSPDLAMAEPWDAAAQKVLDIFTGGLARLLAIIAVIACGIAAIAGKLSWDWAIKIIIGIVLIFGAAAIVDYIISAVGS